ncbi:hypothetical protein [Labilithrix luteola]|uniref:hypothetical protein n=1 Tax=Labilithrix luteola TaxID=1391654 RepID=UPI001473B8F3|nr:hypothetical protein [Labilithrix luteola]
MTDTVDVLNELGTVDMIDMLDVFGGADQAMGRVFEICAPQATTFGPSSGPP